MHFCFVKCVIMFFKNLSFKYKIYSLCRCFYALFNVTDIQIKKSTHTSSLHFEQMHTIQEILSL